MEWSITKNKSWAELERFHWVADMKGVPQDPIHHGEGDVAIHTRMVLEALERLPEFSQLSPSQQEIVWASALLHDVEKRSTTVLEEDGRITSRGHAKRGEFTARRILFEEIPTAFDIREHVAGLVRYHGLPLWVMEKSDPAKAVIEASLRVDMKLLALLAKADVLGRHCTDQRELLDRIDMFQALCEEQSCWDRARQFETGLARFTYFQKQDSSPDYVPFDDLKGGVILMAGLPGMGKDTFVKKHYADLPVVSLDDIRRKHNLKPDDSSATGWAVQQAKELAKSYLRKGEPFVWNATNITRQMREQWIDLFVTYKARVTIVYVETSYKNWQIQNSQREHVVPSAVMSRLLDKLEVPAPHEAHEVVYAVK